MERDGKQTAMIILCKAMEYLPVPPCFPLQHPDRGDRLSQNIVGLEVLEARGALVLDDGRLSIRKMEQKKIISFLQSTQTRLEKQTVRGAKTLEAEEVSQSWVLYVEDDSLTPA